MEIKEIKDREILRNVTVSMPTNALFIVCGEDMLVLESAAKIAFKADSPFTPLTGEVAAYCKLMHSTVEVLANTRTPLEKLELEVKADHLEHWATMIEYKMGILEQVREKERNDEEEINIQGITKFDKDDYIALKFILSNIRWALMITVVETDDLGAVEM